MKGRNIKNGGMNLILLDEIKLRLNNLQEQNNWRGIYNFEPYLEI